MTASLERSPKVAVAFQTRFSDRATKEGKNPMTVEEFIKGNEIKVGQNLNTAIFNYLLELNMMDQTMLDGSLRKMVNPFKIKLKTLKILKTK